MNLKKLVCAGLVLAALSQSASAYYIPNKPDKSKGYYIYAGLGAANLSESEALVPISGQKDAESFDTGMLITAGGGYKFSNGLRAELEYAFRGNTIGDTPNFIVIEGEGDPSYDSKSIMANLLYQFARDKKYSPYIGAGLGYTFLKNGGDADQQYAYQGIAGLIIKVTDNIDLGVAYKYFSTFDTPVMSVKSTPSPVDIEYPYTSHAIELRGILNF
jgi:opacity protein-like surface antigen